MSERIREPIGLAQEQTASIIANWIISIVSFILPVVGLVYPWKAVFEGAAGEVAGYTLSQPVTYYLVSRFLIRVIPLLLNAGMTLVFLFGTCLCLTAFWIEDTGGVIRFTGIEYLPWWVERGGFDILLTKPVDTQFVLSLRRVNCEAVFGLAVGAVVVARSRQKNT